LKALRTATALLDAAGPDSRSNWINPNIRDLPLSEVNNAVLKALIAKMSEGGLSLPPSMIKASKSMTPEPFVTADDIAEHLKVTRRQVLEMARKGLIPAYPLGVGEHRRVWRYKISEVDAAIAAGTRKRSTSNEVGALAQMPAQRTMSVGSPRSQKGKL
jgi:excisionase family DNA binding protein